MLKKSEATTSNDFNDLDALLKQFEQPKKPSAKETGKLPLPSFSTTSNSNDQRRSNIPNSNFLFQTEQRRASILKPPNKPSTEQSFDLEAILQGRTTQNQQTSKISVPIGPAKNVPSQNRRDSLSDLFADERLNAKKPFQTTNHFPTKVSTFAPGKPSLDFNADDLFSDTNNRDSSATKQKFSRTKTSAKDYYNSVARYRPSKVDARFS